MGDYLDKTPETCPVRGVIDRIGDKWSVLIILHLSEGDQRFTGLRRLIPDISQRVLTATLRKLERDGFLWRSIKPTVPPQVTYGLTELGRSLTQQFATLAAWAKASIPAVLAARSSFDSRAD